MRDIVILYLLVLWSIDNIVFLNEEVKESV